jgi:hypothetical protein
VPSPPHSMPSLVPALQLSSPRSTLPVSCADHSRLTDNSVVVALRSLGNVSRVSVSPGLSSGLLLLGLLCRELVFLLWAAEGDPTLRWLWLSRPLVGRQCHGRTSPPASLVGRVALHHLLTKGGVCSAKDDERDVMQVAQNKASREWRSTLRGQRRRDARVTPTGVDAPPDATAGRACDSHHDKAWPSRGPAND